jgi:AcrR family transcriptional regulator
MFTQQTNRWSKRAEGRGPSHCEPIVNAHTPEHALSRQERKQRTRQALLDAALELLESQSFSSLSLRQVTRTAGIVPTAFYRHFANTEELGLALIDESFRTLRAMLRAARANPRTYERVIPSSVEILVRHVHDHDAHFRFIARERFGGMAVLRHAIRSEIRLFASELATDLARFPARDRWTTEDLQLLGGLIVNAMVSTAEAILEAPLDDPNAEDEIIKATERQLRMIMLGVPRWRSSRRLPPAAA